MSLFWLQSQAYGGAPVAPPAPGATYAETLLALTPTAYWRMGEASGNLADSSGNGHTLTAGGTPTYSVAGWPNDGDTAITFSSDWFTKADHADFDVGTGDFSIVWVAIMSSWPAANSQVLGHDGQGNTGEWSVYYTGGLAGRVRVTLNATVYTLLTSPTTLLTDSAYHHCAITCDRSGLATLYVDGAAEATVDISPEVATDLTNTRAFWIGASSAVPGEPFTGTLDEVAYWKSTLLTPEQVAALYDARNGVGGGGDGGGGDEVQADVYAAAVLGYAPVAYYKLSEGSGSVMTDTSPTLNHGSYVGAPTLGVAGPFEGASGVSFTGANNAQAPYHSALNMGSGDWSLVLWLKSATAWDAVLYRWIVSRSAGLGLYELVELLTTDRLACSVSTVDGLTTVYAFTDAGVTLHSDAWVMVAYTADRTGLGTLYINGVSADTFDISPYLYPLDDTASLYLARATHTARFWTGSLSNVSIHASLLSGANIAALYAAGGY